VTDKHSPEYRALQIALRELRAEAGITQRQLAERLNVHPSFVAKYEVGERRLDLVEIRAIREAFGTTVADVVLRMEAKLH